MEQSTRITGLLLGSAAARWPGRPPSAIAKTRLNGPQQIIELGFTGDSQADPQNHGGPVKAVHHYPSDHSPQWIAEGQMPAAPSPWLDACPAADPRPGAGQDAALSRRDQPSTASTARRVAATT